MPVAYRYALYLAPPDPWRAVGGAWLGRDPETGALIAPAADADPRQAAWTREPRRYGLHATLKPPFRLKPGTTVQGLDQAVRALALRTRVFDATLHCRVLRGFWAWCLADNAHACAHMRALGADAVQALDDWRAPPTEAELARRRHTGLSAAHQDMLERWGYPYVLDQFIFHITLSDRLDEPALQDAGARVRALSAPLLGQPMPVRAVSLYVQAEADAPFLVARHYGFDGGTVDCAGAVYLR